MPYYDYKCTKCGFIFELLRRMNETLEPVCIKCKSTARQVFYPPRTNRSDKDILDSAGSEQSGSCSSCSSGVCSTCHGR